MVCENRGKVTADNRNKAWSMARRIDGMIDKYDDYPNGISERDIESATSVQLARVIEIYTQEFTEVIEEVIDLSDNLKIKIEKYRIYSKIVSNQLRIFDEENGIQVSLLLGSLLEGTLQFFLYAFEQDYINARWKQWEISDAQFSVITQKIKLHLDGFETDGVLTKRQKDSLLAIIQKELDTRKNGKNIDRIMLDELIGLCSNQQIFDKKTDVGKRTIEAMNRIREARNNIHVFSRYPIPTKDEIVDDAKQFCLIMKDLLFRISCISEDRRKEAFKEIVLDIPGTVIIDVNDNYEVLGIHGRDKSLIEKLMNTEEDKHNEQ